MTSYNSLRKPLHYITAYNSVMRAVLRFLIENSNFCYSTATNVEIQLPVPSDATNPNIRTSMGSASYAPESDALVWKIKSFPGNKVGFCLELYFIHIHYFIMY